MFDHREEWPDGPLPDDVLLVDDEPELTDAEYWAMVDDLIAKDPEPWPDPTREERAARAREVIALGESAPLTPVLIGQVQALDVSLLDEDGRLGLSMFWQWVTNHAEAERGLAVAATVAACADDRDAPRELQAAAQLGAALGLGSGAADTLVAASSQFAENLPGTRAMALAGDLPWRKVSTLALATVGMTPAQIARVEAKVLPKAAGRSPAAHDAAVRRAVEQVDPGKADRDRNDREHDIRMAKHHYGAGMGQLFADMPSEDLDLTWTAANAFARRLKAAGDPRPLDQLRVAFLAHAARSYLTHGDPAYCDHHCDPLPPDPQPDEPLPPEPPEPESFTNHDDDEPTETPPPTSSPSSPPPSTPPTQHGRPVALHVTWDLTSLLGLTSHCGELRDSATLLPPTAMRDLLTGGARIRRMVIDPNTGEQLDLTPRSWDLPPTDSRAHRQPVVLTITTTERLDDLPADLRAAVDDSDVAAMLRELLDYPLTADDLDNTPDADTPSAALAEFTASRAGHPVNPCAGPTAASAADIDHHEARSAGGKTIRTNLGPLTRRWHRLKTFTDWTVSQVKRTWEWISPTGRTYTIEPHDYRLGP
jgi:hypothetical protein